MKTNSINQRKKRLAPAKHSVWRKVLNLLLNYGALITDVERATGRKYDVREWIQ